MRISPISIGECIATILDFELLAERELYSSLTSLFISSYRSGEILEQSGDLDFATCPETPRFGGASP